MPEQTLQITVQTWQALLAIVTFVFLTGAAWGSLILTVKHLGKSLDNLTGRFNDWLHDLAVKSATAEGKTGSPMVPTDIALKLLLDSGVKAVIDDQNFKNWFFPLVDKLAPKDSFEVEQKVFLALEQSKDDARWIKVREYIYNHPIYNERPLTMDRLMVITSWILRDQYRTSRDTKP